MSNNIDFQTIKLIDSDVTKLVYKPVNNDVTGQVGAFIGNGKLGIISHFDSIDVQKTMITTEIKYTSGVYKSNIIEPFYTNKVMFFDDYNQSSKTVVTTQRQELSLSFATFFSSFLIEDTSYVIQPFNEYRKLNVDMYLYCPYHLPYCSIQTLDITSLGDDNLTMDIPIFHEVYTNKNLTNITYNNNFIKVNESPNGLFILSGSGIDKSSNSTVAFACAYNFIYPAGYNDTAQNLGFNIYRYDQDKACNHFMLPNVSIGEIIKMQIISANMTSVDFENPVEEVKRIVLANVSSLQRTREQHVSKWVSRWSSNMTIGEKTGIPFEKAGDIQAINTFIKVAYYNIYASTRENINTEINSLNLFVMDREGMVLYEGDLWFIPLLTIIKPESARSLLEQRYKTIEMAQQISGGYGYKGAKYPYSNDMLGYKHMVYYNTTSAISLFNNALIALNVWNYYRITKEYDWLQSKGFAIMKNIANFFISIINHDPDTNVYSINNMASISNDTAQTNNSFTNNMIKLTFKYTTEACYVLGIKPVDKWMQYYNGLPILYTNPETFRNILKVSEESDDTSSFFILDALFVIIPYYSEIFFTESNINIQMALKDNIDYYIEKIKTDYANHPYNTALLGIIHGMYAQYDETYACNFDYYLHKFITDTIFNNNDTGSDNVWYNMKSFGSSTSNSLTTNSIFLLMIMQALPQVHVQGGISSTKFYYTEMKESVRKYAIMPYHWKDIKLSNIGNPDDIKTYVVKNQSLVTSLTVCTHNPPPPDPDPGPTTTTPAPDTFTGI